jgi:DNA-binding response OmpR family regulator
MVLAYVSSSDPDTTIARAEDGMGFRVLIVAKYLRRARPWLDLVRLSGFDFVATNSVQSARALMPTKLLDAMVMDLTDQVRGGLALCRKVRAGGSTLPVLMLHPLGTAEDLLTGFEAGTDAYLRGEIEPAEVVGHLRSLCRRQRNLLPPTLLTNTASQGAAHTGQQRENACTSDEEVCHRDH